MTIEDQVKAIEEQVRSLIVDQLGVEADKVVLEAKFTDDLGADSLDQVELVMALEEKFSLNISDEDAAKIETVQQAIDYIMNHK